MKPEKYARKVARKRMLELGEPYHVALTEAYRWIRRRNQGRQLIASALAITGVAWTLSLSFL